MDNIYVEKAIETIYCQIVENLPNDVCNDCPIVKMIGDVMCQIKNRNNVEIAEKLGIDKIKFESCPCFKK